MYPRGRKRNVLLFIQHCMYYFLGVSKQQLFTRKEKDFFVNQIILNDVFYIK